MTTRAQVYITATVACGILLIAISLGGLRDALRSPAYGPFFLFALLGSTLKIRIPRLTGTISVNFLFVLIAASVFTFAETVLMASAAGTVQCCWRPKRRPRFIQVCFNVAALAISSAVAYRCSHLITVADGSSFAVLLTTGGCMYFVVNTFLVSGVLCLIEHKPLLDVWRQCYLWSFPYYLLGTGIAGLVVLTGRSHGWTASFAILPSIFLLYVFYHLCVEWVAGALQAGGNTACQADRARIDGTPHYPLMHGLASTRTPL
jgi:hypothetical protein